MLLPQMIGKRKLFTSLSDLHIDASSAFSGIQKTGHPPFKKLRKSDSRFTSLFSDWGFEGFLRSFCPGSKPAYLYPGVKTDVLIGQAICSWTFPFPSGTSTILLLQLGMLGRFSESALVHCAGPPNSANISCHS